MRALILILVLMQVNVTGYRDVVLRLADLGSAVELPRPGDKKQRLQDYMCSMQQVVGALQVPHAAHRSRSVCHRGEVPTSRRCWHLMTRRARSVLGRGEVLTSRRCRCR